MIDSKEMLTDIQVLINTERGSVSVPGLTHDNCPGLAVTMHPFGAFTVTHIESGMKMCGGYERASSAILVMSQYALIAASKSASFKGLDQQGAINLISDAGSDDVPFDGCTSTSIEGVRKLTVKEWQGSLTNCFLDEFPWEENDPFEGAVQNFAKIGVPA